VPDHRPAEDVSLGRVADAKLVGSLDELIEEDAICGA
jgi:hypothetical protein